jgi:hypothetical protein
MPLSKQYVPSSRTIDCDYSWKGSTNRSQNAECKIYSHTAMAVAFKELEKIFLPCK